MSSRSYNDNEGEEEGEEEEGEEGGGGGRERRERREKGGGRRRRGNKPMKDALFITDGEFGLFKFSRTKLSALHYTFILHHNIYYINTFIIDITPYNIYINTLTLQ